MTYTSRYRARRAMTMTEIVVAFFILGLLGLLAAQSFNTTTDGVSDEAASIRLGIAQVAAGQVSASVGYYPADLSSRLRPAGTEVLAGNESPTTADQVSVARVDDTTLVIAAAGSTGSCVVLFDSLSAPTMWGIDPAVSEGGCTADAARSYHPSVNPSSPVTSKSAEDPSSIALP